MDDDIFYMCKIDFECELGFAMGGNIVYPSVEDLKKHRKCVDSCGIVAVRISLDHVVSEGDY